MQTQIKDDQISIARAHKYGGGGGLGGEKIDLDKFRSPPSY